MQTIKLEQELACAASKVWEVISNVCRSDWAPMVNSITLDNDVRSFEMEGIGPIKERILEVDHDNFCLRYSGISTPANVEHHLATFRVTPNGQGCRLQWTTEIAPDQFAATVQAGMQHSIEGLKKVLGMNQ